MNARAALAVAAVALAAVACEREKRGFEPTRESSGLPSVQVSDLRAGANSPTMNEKGPYDDNAYAMSQGKTLFTQMNCEGCHSHGGGGMGPPLMDADWIYGARPSQIFATIYEGRPNGMPSFRGRLTNDQIWQLVAYVQSMSGIGSRAARSGRDDHMYMRSSEQNTKTPASKKNGGSRSTER